jgi:hypothetical protein
LVDGDLQKLHGGSVVWRRTILGDVFLVFFGSVKRSGSADELMRDFAFVLGELGER